MKRFDVGSRCHLGCLAVVLAALLGPAAGGAGGQFDGGPSRDPEVDGAWTPICPKPDAQWSHTAIHDPVWNRMIVFGSNGLWALSLSGTPVWTRMAAAGTPPPALEGHSAIYDPTRQRMIVYGGTYGGSYTTETWVLSLSGNPTWSRLPTASGTAPSRCHHTAVYDPVRDRMLIFGGYDIYQILWYDDTWALSLSGTPTWTRVPTSGAPPTARHMHSAIYDPFRDRMVVFGGKLRGGDVLDDTWELTLAGTPTWHQLFPAGLTPPARCGHSAIYDPARHRMVIFGGWGLNDVWWLSLTGTLRWVRLAPSGTPPRGRISQAAIHDPLQDRMVIFGGYGGGALDDTWMLSFPEEPSWSQLAVQGPRLAGASEIFDPVRQRMITFAGWHQLYGRTNEVWSFSFADDPHWRQLAPEGTPPEPREGHSATYDPVRDRMVVFGGTPVDDDRVWLLSLGDTPTWSAVLPEGPSPGHRHGHSIIYDPVRDRMVMFGGESQAWALALSEPLTWSPVNALGVPPTRVTDHAAIYDPLQDRMIIFGGRDYPGHELNETWALSFSGTPTWSRLEPGEPVPSARGSHVGIYDPVGARLVIFGGIGVAGYSNDAWSLALDDPPVWTRLAPSGAVPATRSYLVGIYDPNRRGMLIHGGQRAGGLAFDDTWELTWRPPTGTPKDRAVARQTLVREPVLLDVTPNPFGRSTTIHFDIPAPGTRLTLSVYDVGGRLVRTLLAGEVAPGAFDACWDGLDDDGGRLPSGVYLTRMATPAGAVRGRIVLAR